MKAFIISLCIALGFGLFTVQAVQAQELCDNPNAQGTQFCKDQSTATATNNTVVGPNGILTKVVSVLSMIVAVAAVIAVIIGGFMFVTSNGDSGQVSKGRQTVIYGLVGIAVAILARSIVAFVLNRL